MVMVVVMIIDKEDNDDDDRGWDPREPLGALSYIAIRHVSFY